MLEMYHGLWLAKKLILKLFLTYHQSMKVDPFFNRPDVLTILSLYSFSSDFLTLVFGDCRQANNPDERQIRAHSRELYNVICTAI